MSQFAAAPGTDSLLFTSLVPCRYTFSAVAVEALGGRLHCFATFDNAYHTFVQLTLGNGLHDVFMQARQAQCNRTVLVLVSYLLIQVMVVQQLVTALIVEFYTRVDAKEYHRNMVKSGSPVPTFSRHRLQRMATTKQLYKKMDVASGKSLFRGVSPLRQRGGSDIDELKRELAVGTHTFDEPLLRDATEWVRAKARDPKCWPDKVLPQVQDLVELHRAKHRA